MNLFDFPYKTTYKKSDPLSLYSPLGEIKLEIKLNETRLSDLPLKKEGIIFNDSHIYIWESNRFHLELLKIIFDPELPQGMHTDNCTGFFCRFKCLSQKIQPQFSCRLIPQKKSLMGNPESGEGLIAQSWEDERIKLTIGTEDEEFLNSRAEHQKGLPHRFAIDNILVNNFTYEYLNDAIKLSLPVFLENEEGQVQFIISWTKTRNRSCSSTWFAVNESYENVLKLKEKFKDASD